MRDINEEIARHIKKLKKKKQIKLGVTNIIRISECPLKAIFYSSLCPIEMPTTKAFVSGIISHYAYELYYDLDNIGTDNDSIEYVLKQATERLRNERTAEYTYFESKKDEIIASSYGYIRTFLKWAQYQPRPYRRELYITHGLVEGIIDRIDMINDKILITDYKTTSSTPKKDTLETYKTQLGGYIWLMRKTTNKPLEMLPPRIVIFKKASWETITIHDFEDYVEDFEGMVYYVARMLLKLTKGKLPKGKPSDKCYYCLARNICPYRL